MSASLVVPTVSALDHERLRRIASAGMRIRRAPPSAMVLASARRVLGDAHAAEDVCQAAFLLLARKAGSGRWQPSVAGWLYRTAHHLALKARTAIEPRAGIRVPEHPRDVP